MKLVHVEDYFDPNAGYQINEFIRIKVPGVDQVVISSNDLSPFHKTLNVEEDKRASELYCFELIRLDVLIKISKRIVLRNLWRTIDSLKPDILFLHGIGDFKDIILFTSKKKYKIVRDCHMSWVASTNPFSKFYLKMFSLIFSSKINDSNKYAKVYALGNEEFDYLNAMGIRGEKIEILPHGFNKFYFYFDQIARATIRKELEIANSEILISYIGKFDSFKQPHLIFDIVSTEIMKKYPIRLLFLGPKNKHYMDEIFTPRMIKYNENEKITLLPGKNFNELKDWFSASDICIWPKQTTLSSIHAQVCGTTVIMEDHLSNQERVLNNKNLYTIGNLESATNILKRVIKEQDYIKSNEIKLDKRLSEREYSNQINTLVNLISN